VYSPDAEYNALSLDPYKNEVSQTEERVIEHEIELSGLLPNTKYHYQVQVFRIPEATAKSSDFVFTTKTSKVTPTIARIGKTEITINWITGEPATSIIEYTNLVTGRRERAIKQREETTHSIVLEDLVIDTPYRITVFGVGESGNLIEAQEDLTVRTGRDTVAPTIKSLKISNTLIPGRNDLVQTTVSWRTDEPAIGRVEYLEGASIVNETLVNSEEKPDALTTEHGFIITKLRPGRIYQIKVIATDEAGNRSESPTRLIVTPRQSESIFDIVIKNFEDTFQFVRKL